jgi:hypothetical protein
MLNYKHLVASWASWKSASGPRAQLLAHYTPSPASKEPGQLPGLAGPWVRQWLPLTSLAELPLPISHVSRDDVGRPPTNSWAEQPRSGIVSEAVAICERRWNEKSHADRRK